MGKFQKFSEFVSKKDALMNAKDGLAGKDYDGPLSTKPPQEPTKGKKDKPLPYKASGEVEKGVVFTAADDGKKKGLGWEATPGITPQTSPLGKNVEDKSKPVSKKKLKTEQFIEETKNMTDSEFASYILEQHDTTLSTVTDLFGNEYTPDPTQTIQYLVGLMMGNHTYMERFIRELKRRDGLRDLVTELFEIGDTYELVVDNLEEPENGMDKASRLARSMNDRYMSVFDNFDFGDEDEFEESVGPGVDAYQDIMPSQSSANKTQGGAFGGGSALNGNVQDPSYKDRSVYSTDDNKDKNTMGAQSVHTPAGSVMGGATSPQFAGQGGAMPPVMPPKKMSDGSSRPKFKGESAAHHMINELSMYPHFKDHMKSRCIDC